MAIITSKKVLPGQPGTKRLVKKYGDKLIAVRYKDDPGRKRKIKTVEILVDEWDWKENKRTPLNKTVHLQINYGERRLGRLVRNAGGYWNKDRKYWELRYEAVMQLGLEDRIIRD